MKEVMERVSAILDSPVFRYTWQKSYRRMWIICLVYLLIFCTSVSAEDSSQLTFTPYENKSGKLMDFSTDAKPKHFDIEGMKAVNEASQAMEEVDDLVIKLVNSIHDLSTLEPKTEHDELAIKEAFAKLDALVTYIESKLNFGKEQLKKVKPLTDDEIAKVDSLELTFNTNLIKAKEIKKQIASRLATTLIKETK